MADTDGSAVVPVLSATGEAKYAPPDATASTNPAPHDGDNSNAAERAAECAHALAQEILSFAEPLVLPQQWKFLDGESPTWYRLAAPPEEVVDSLVEQFREDALVEIGLLERVGEELKLKVPISEEGLIYHVEWQSPDTFRVCPRDGHEISSGAISSLTECVARDAKSGREILLIVGSPVDVEILARLGLRAVVSDELQALCRSDVDQVFRRDVPDEEWRYEPVLVDFDLAGMRNVSIPGIQLAIKRLADAQQVYGVDPGQRFRVWRPDSHQFSLLEQTVLFEDRDQIGEFVRRFVSSVPYRRAQDWNWQLDQRGLTFAEARNKLEEALKYGRQGLPPSRLEAAYQAFRSAGHQFFVAGFEREAAATPDPVKRLVFAQAETVARKFVDDHPLAVEARYLIAGEPMPAEVGQSTEDTTQCLHRCNQLLRLRRSLIRG